MQNEILIIPDVHGRRFWKAAVEKYPERETIFLGDYLDPYPQEGISSQEAIENFKDIIEYAKRKNNVTLLMGNHDLHYLIVLDGDRKDKERETEIRNIFIENISLFNLVKQLKIQNKLYVFSHSPILDRWVKGTGIPSVPYMLISELNDKLQDLSSNKYYLESILNFISYYRGGFDSYGSSVWGDVRELILDDNKILEGIDYNIFGHTHLTAPIITETYACLDTEQAYVLLETGKIKTV